MAFTVADFHDLLRLLRERPEWQAELRRLLLSEEVTALPEAVRELSRTVERLAHEFATFRIETDRRFQELAEAQRRTEERLGRVEERQDRLEVAVAALAEAQRRTEQRVGELAEAQRRTEQRVEELAEAQRRTEEHLNRLTEKVDAMGTALGALSSRVGSTVEEEAESVLWALLPQKGYQPLREGFTLAIDGELDVVLPARGPDGETVWAVVEAKVRLSHRAVRDWADRMHAPGTWARLAAAGVPGPYLVYAYGMRVDLGAEQEAARSGIGLLTGRGERVAPRGLVRPGTE